MRCFNHPQTDIVALCAQCQKGICTDCAHYVQTAQAVLCQPCYGAGIQAEIVHAQQSINRAFIFTGVVGLLPCLFIIPAIFQDISAIPGLLLLPLSLAFSWCLFWGWMPVWHGFRNFFAGWGCFGTLTFVVILASITAEILVWIAVINGAFTGIRKYNEAKRIIANGNQQLAELYGRNMPMQQMAPPQG